MPSLGPGGGREAAGRTQPIRTWGDWAIDYVSDPKDAYAERSIYQCHNPRTVAKIQTRVVKHGKRSSVSRFLRSKSDKDKIAVWRYDLLRILQVFNVRPIGSICYVGLSDLILLD